MEKSCSYKKKSRFTHLDTTVFCNIIHEDAIKTDYNIWKNIKGFHEKHIFAKFLELVNFYVNVNLCFDSCSKLDLNLTQKLLFETFDSKGFYIWLSSFTNNWPRNFPCLANIKPLKFILDFQNENYYLHSPSENFIEGWIIKY